MAIFLPVHPPLSSEGNEGKTLLQKWINLDWVGTILTLGMTVSLLLPLTWGGVTREWNDRVIIALFVLVSLLRIFLVKYALMFCQSGVLFVVLILWERRLGKRAMIPLDIFTRRTQVSLRVTIVAIYWLIIHFIARRWDCHFQHHDDWYDHDILHPFLLPSERQDCRTKWYRSHSIYDGNGRGIYPGWLFE